MWFWRPLPCLMVVACFLLVPCLVHYVQWSFRWRFLESGWSTKPTVLQLQRSVQITWKERLQWHCCICHSDAGLFTVTLEWRLISELIPVWLRRVNEELAHLFCSYIFTQAPWKHGSEVKGSFCLHAVKWWHTFTTNKGSRTDWVPHRMALWVQSPYRFNPIYVL